MKLQSAHLLVGSAFLASALVFACAGSDDTDIPGDSNNNGAKGNGNSTDTSSTLPPSNPSGGSTTSSGGSTSSSGGSTSSSGSATSSSGSTTSSSGGSSGSSGSSVPACSWAGDFSKMLSKMSEIQAGAPCDSTCDPATHCCLDLFGGAGGGGTSGGLPLDAGTSSGGTSGGLPTGTGGTCVTNN